jgi:hypothetical protein
MARQQERHPNFFIVGAAKAGTTSLYHYLSAHTDIFMSPIKEPNYFAKDVVNRLPVEARRVLQLNYRAFVRTGRACDDAFVPTWDQYCELFSRTGAQCAIGEASTFYLLSTHAAKDIRDACPGAKIIIVLRDPVERAYSHYLMNLRAGSARGGFLAEFREGLKEGTEERASFVYRSMGMYSRQVERYLRYFPVERVKILLYDDMRSNLNSFVRSVLQFLEVDSDVELVSQERFNRARLPRYPRLNALLLSTGLKKWFARVAPAPAARFAWQVFFTDRAVPRLSMEERAQALPFFRDDIERLQTLIGRNLSRWLQ